MKKKIAIATGVLFVLWAGGLFIICTAAEFSVGYTDPSRSLLQAVDRVGGIEQVSQTKDFSQLTAIAERMTEYARRPYRTLRNMKTLSGLTSVIAGVLILVFARWIPGSDERTATTPADE